MAAANVNNAQLDLVNNYAKSAAGLLSCCRWAQQVLEKQLAAWHEQYRQKPEYRCTGAPCPSFGKKPKQSTHCAGCVNWTKVIIKELATNADHILWQFAESSKFSESSLAVAKLFTLRTMPLADVQKKKVYADLDSAMILAIMSQTRLIEGFPDLIKKVRWA